MAAFLVVEAMDVRDPEVINRYAAEVVPIVTARGGRYLARGSAVVLEGENRPQMLVVVQFESLQQIEDLYDSAEYAPLKAMRQAAGTLNFIAVDGLA